MAKGRVFGTRVVRGKAQKCVPGSHRQAILYNVYYDSSVVWWIAGFSLWIIIFTLCNIAKKNYWRKSFSGTCFCFFGKNCDSNFFWLAFSVRKWLFCCTFWSSTYETKNAQSSSRSRDRKEHPRVFTRDAGGWREYGMRLLRYSQWQRDRFAS